jgi:hypothetical protein
MAAIATPVDSSSTITSTKASPGPTLAASEPELLTLCKTTQAKQNILIECQGAY